MPLPTATRAISCWDGLGGLCTLLLVRAAVGTRGCRVASVAEDRYSILARMGFTGGRCEASFASPSGVDVESPLSRFFDVLGSLPTFL